MARYVLLRVDDDDEADALLLDLVVHPYWSIHTGYVEATVHVELTDSIDAGDTDYSTTLGAYGRSVVEDGSLQRYVQESYRRAHTLIAIHEDTGDQL